MKTIIIFGAILLLSFDSLASKNQTNKKKKLTIVFIEIIKEKEIYKKLAFPVSITPIKQLQIKSPANGHISIHNFKLGELVKKNKIISKLKRIDNGLTYKPISIRAPFAGKITRIFINEGHNVNTNDSIIELSDLSDNIITFEVPGEDIESLQKGTLGSLEISNNKKYPVQIKQVSGQVSKLTGTAQIFLKTKSKQYINKMYGVVNFKLNKHFGILVSEDTLHYKGNEIYINVVNSKNIIEQKIVKLNSHKGDFAEIKSGLIIGDMIVTKSAKFLKAKEKVTIANLSSKKNKGNKKKVINENKK